MPCPAGGIFFLQESAPIGVASCRPIESAVLWLLVKLLFCKFYYLAWGEDVGCRGGQILPGRSQNWAQIGFFLPHGILKDARPRSGQHGAEIASGINGWGTERCTKDAWTAYGGRTEELTSGTVAHTIPTVASACFVLRPFAHSARPGIPGKFSVVEVSQ